MIVRLLTAPSVIVMRSPVERAMRLEYLTVGWNTLEVFVTIGLGVASGSLALAAFGLDSLVEIFASGTVLWQLRPTRCRDSSCIMAIVGLRSWFLGELLPQSPTAVEWRLRPNIRPATLRSVSRISQ